MKQHTGTYKNGELLAMWRKQAKAEMMKEYRRLRNVAESCTSFKSGAPGDYAQSLAIIGQCYANAAACFDAEVTPFAWDDDGATQASNAQVCGPAQEACRGK